MADSIAINETNRLISSDKVEGTSVYNRAGEKLGSIRNFMVEKRGGKAEYAVLEFGGLFGLGADHYPIPWDMLDYSTDLGGYVVDIDKSRLENAPRYASEEPAYDHVYGREVYGYWGVPYPFV
ncbi:MAG: PRC-barrel domain-containing protein [Sphingomonadales bacterium]|mgnify:CR=1 FL=1|nr:PRC-barrel domain-containing protein [Sphingomonadales bacterium]